MGKKGGLSFFRFPLKDKDRCSKWTAAVKRAKWQPTRLCSEHFVTVTGKLDMFLTRKLKKVAT